MQEWIAKAKLSRTPDQLRFRYPFLHNRKSTVKNKSIVRIEGPGARSPTLVSGRLRLKPASSVKSGLTSGDPKNNLYISIGVAPIKFWRIRGPSWLNSHKRKGRRWPGKVWRISITCVTLTRL